jgi:hypothetical protein
VFSGFGHFLCLETPAIHHRDPRPFSTLQVDLWRMDLPALGVQMCATSVALPLTERGNGAAEHVTGVLHRREPRHRGGGFVAENKTKNLS